MRIQQSKKQFLIFFMVGFVAGVFYANIAIKNYLAASGILSDYFLNQYINTEIVVEDYIMYILRVRLVPLAILGVLGCTKFRKIAVIGTLVWTGFSSGLILVEAVIKLGVKGIVLCLVAVVPHFIFYILAYIVILWHLYSYPARKWDMSKTVFVVLTIIIGMVMEGYVNPILMKMFIKVL